MSVKIRKPETGVNYFCTFTNYRWIKLFDICSFYEHIYDWFDILKKSNIDLTGYVIMPNHLHCILYLPSCSKTIDKVIGNGKRFMAYDLVKILNELNRQDILYVMEQGVSEIEKLKGQKHKVFQPSFDAKPCYKHSFLIQKLNYIHNNPVRAGLASLPEDYIHSSAKYYLTSQQGIYPVTHYLYSYGEEPYFEWAKSNIPPRNQ